MNDSIPMRVCLTFDAEHPDRPWCPPGNAGRILDILADEGVVATFFVQGRWAEAEPEIAGRIADDGHLVGHHSFYHARMSLLSPDGLRADVADGQRVIIEHTGVDPRPWFRCPFGAGHDQPRVIDSLQTLGYRNVHWNVELQDWEPWRTGEDIAHDAVERVGSVGDQAVILLHTWPGGTSDALRPMIAGLRAMGATFETIDHLERLP
ncbi:MAG TPA: polysaccharide deacetylase family protein [Actinomycetota bacterium]